MWNRLHVTRVSWSLVDQGIVSGGTFVVSILLARHLPAAEYGAFALLFGGMLTLQLFNATLLFHPLSVRLAAAPVQDRLRLLAASLALIMLLSAGLGAVLWLTLIALGRRDLVLPGLACFLLWQLQEALRRGLISGFRYRAASLGDALSYLGQAVVVLILLSCDALTLAGALYGMAATSGLAAAVQAHQLGLRAVTPLRLRETAVDYWSIGGGWSLGTGLLLQARSQVLIWLLAAGSGAGAVAALQAAQNIVNLANPVMLGLCNIIPQATAQASGKGSAHAWRAARPYALLAMPLLCGYAAVVLSAPGVILWILYGEQSEYLDLSLPVRLLIAAALAGYATDIVVSFLHGVTAVRPAFLINALGAATAAVLAFPMGPLGLVGVCMAMIASNLARLIASYFTMTRLMARADGLA